MVELQDGRTNWPLCITGHQGMRAKGSFQVVYGVGYGDVSRAGRKTRKAAKGSGGGDTVRPESRVCPPEAKVKKVTQSECPTRVLYCSDYPAPPCCFGGFSGPLLLWPLVSSWSLYSRNCPIF
uniref:Uncharacterized protein n=1 Tax=Arundo donax TaxID=35708 RepID=A0A0A8Y530_ARUDO